MHAFVCWPKLIAGGPFGGGFSGIWLNYVFVLLTFFQHMIILFMICKRIENHFFAGGGDTGDDR